MLNERIHPDVELRTALKGEIEWGPFASPYMREIMRKFGKVAFARSSACAEFESFLRDIRLKTARRKGDFIGETCLEIGTFYGITAVLLSQYFERVICVSVDLAGDRDMKRRIVEHLGIKNVAFHDAKNNEEKAAFVKAAPFDFCYMDGDHTNDTALDFGLVSRCGRILFHEYWPLQPAVWNLVNDLPQEEVLRANFDCLAYWEARR